MWSCSRCNGSIELWQHTYNFLQPFFVTWDRILGTYWEENWRGSWRNQRSFLVIWFCKCYSRWNTLISYNSSIQILGWKCNRGGAKFWNLPMQMQARGRTFGYHHLIWVGMWCFLSLNIHSFCLASKLLIVKISRSHYPYSPQLH